MNKAFMSMAGLFLILSLINCAGTQKPDPAVIACKSGCDTAYTACIKKAAKNEAKKAACEAVKSKCFTDCEAK